MKKIHWFPVLCAVLIAATFICAMIGSNPHRILGLGRMQKAEQNYETLRAEMERMLSDGDYSRLSDYCDLHDIRGNGGNFASLRGCIRLAKAYAAVESDLMNIYFECGAVSTADGADSAGGGPVTGARDDANRKDSDPCSNDSPVDGYFQPASAASLLSYDLSAFAKQVRSAESATGTAHEVVLCRDAAGDADRRIRKALSAVLSMNDAEIRQLFDADEDARTVLILERLQGSG